MTKPGLMLRPGLLNAPYLFQEEGGGHNDLGRIT